jgi:hypothetical protein
MDGDKLLELLGQPVEADPVQAALRDLARGIQPELDPGRSDLFVDWVTVNEIGLEFGFEDEAYVRARPIDMRRQGPLLLTQLYFYGNTSRTQPFPGRLPRGLTLQDDREAVRGKLAALEAVRRSYTRDCWLVEGYEIVVAYQAGTGTVESVMCHVPYDPWPLPPDEEDILAPYTPERLCGFFGERWSSARLREALGPLGYASVMTSARSAHCADLRMVHGIEFGFAPGHQVAAASPKFPQAMALATVTFYGPRVFDARMWAGPMPLKLEFTDSQAEIAAKLGRKPDVRRDFDRNGYVLWHFDRFSLRAEYSNIENRLLRVTLMAPGYWRSTGARSD